MAINFQGGNHDRISRIFSHKFFEEKKIEIPVQREPTTQMFSSVLNQYLAILQVATWTKYTGASVIGCKATKPHSNGIVFDRRLNWFCGIEIDSNQFSFSSILLNDTGFFY